MRRAGAVLVMCGCRAGAVRVPCDGVRPIASVHDEDDPVGHDVQVVSGVVKRLDYDMQCSCPGADPGGGARGPCPPPIFWGGKQGGQKPHTQKKKSKSDDHEARYRLKRTPKHTKYAQIFKKKIL